MTPVSSAPGAEVSPPPAIAILLTCFNRREKTLDALAALGRQETRIPRRVHIILVDDASKDGTAEAVRQQFPEVELLSGDGTLFWNGGMRKAFARAREIGFDYYLWLNDDTFLFPDCIDKLLAASQWLASTGRTAIVTGSTCDPTTRLRTYGGIHRIWRWNGFRDVPVVPGEQDTVACSTMNGSCTLVPSAVVERLGILDPHYTQQFGDFDYGFRAVRAGFEVHVAPGFVGTCTANSRVGTWRDTSAGLRRRWKHLMSPKGLPPRDWWVFTSRHTGYLWPLYFLWPYIKVPVSSLLPKRR